MGSGSSKRWSHAHKLHNPSTTLFQNDTSNFDYKDGSKSFNEYFETNISRRDETIFQTKSLSDQEEVKSAFRHVTLARRQEAKSWIAQRSSLDNSNNTITKSSFSTKFGFK